MPIQGNDGLSELHEFLLIGKCGFPLELHHRSESGQLVGDCFFGLGAFA